MSAILPRVLVLDPEPFMRELIKLRLEPLALKVHFAEDEHEARTALAKVRPQLIILDIMHPKLDSYKFVQTVKSHPALEATKIIILSFKKRDPETLFLYNVWIEDYFEKPFIPDKLVKKVREVLGIKGEN